jgi:hypothetical protein
MSLGMNRTQLVLAAILVDFTALTGWALYETSWEAFATTMQNPLMIQTAADLVIALAACGFFIWRDAKQRGINPLPYLLLTLLGSPGPLAYLIRRAADPQPAGALATA